MNFRLPGFKCYENCTHDSMLKLMQARRICPQQYKTFTIAWHFLINTKYSGEVSLIISVDVCRELTQCVRTWIFSKCRKHWDFPLCPSSTVASTFNPRLYLYNYFRCLNKIISYVIRGIKQAISRKLVKISDYLVSSLKTVPGCRVSRHILFSNKEIISSDLQNMGSFVSLVGTFE